MTAIPEQFEHGADVGVRGRGATLAEAFAGAATALSSLWAADAESVRPLLRETISCEAADVERLLVAFLDELIYAFATRRLVFTDFDVRIDAVPGRPVGLVAKARGERYDPRRHESTVEPKGATYTALSVAREANGFVAQCVVDV